MRCFEMTYIKVNGEVYTTTVSRKETDHAWDDREIKEVTLAMSYTEVLSLLPYNAPWSVIVKEPMLDDDGNQALDESGNIVLEEDGTEVDMSEYSMSGDIIDHRDGTVTIKMGKPTDLETAYEMLIGGDAE
jgi:hypothetical protein